MNEGGGIFGDGMAENCSGRGCSLPDVCVLGDGDVSGDKSAPVNLIVFVAGSVQNFHHVAACASHLLVHHVFYLFFVGD